MFLKSLVELVEDRLEHLRHSFKFIIQSSKFFTHGFIYGGRSISFHGFNDRLKFVLALKVSWHEVHLNVHDGLDDLLKVLALWFFFFS